MYGKIYRIFYLILFIFTFSLSAFATSHIVKLKITNSNSETNCEDKWCQVYVEIPAKLYMDKGWLRTDLKNLRFKDGSRDLSYWVIPKADNNYKINKLGLWLLVYDLEANSTKYVNMIIDDNNTLSYCNPRATSDDKSEDRSSYECASTVFPFYSYNLNDWKWTKYPADNKWSDPDTKFIDNTLYTVDTLRPLKTGSEAKTGNEFTIHIDNMKFYNPSGKYYSEAMIYFLSQATYERADKLQRKSGYRLYIKKASDFGNVSDDYHYSMKHFVILIQKKSPGSGWVNQVKTNWYPYNNTRHVFDIKVSDSRISLWINGKHFDFSAVNGNVDSNKDFIRTDDWENGYFGIDRKGWRLCCGSDIDYIILRNYFKVEPKVQVYGNTDVVVGKYNESQGKDIIEINPDVQRVYEDLGGNTLDRYIFSTLDIARQNQIVKDFSLTIRNRSSSTAHFHISINMQTFSSNADDWIVYWCNSNGDNCTIEQPTTLTIDGQGEKTYVLKIIPSPSVLFNGDVLSLKVNVTCDEDASFDNAEYIVNVYPKLACYWKYKLPIAVDWQKAHGYPTLYNYQVLVNIKSTKLSEANDNGTDIIVTDNSGNKIPFWIKNFDKNNGKLSLWVKVPKINNGNNTIYVWWGNRNFKIPMSDIHKTFDLYEDWHSYPKNFVVGCPDGTLQCLGANPDIDGWSNIPTPDDFYNWWIIRELPKGNRILQADIYRNGKAIDVHNGLCGYSDGSGHSCDKGPYLFNGNVGWNHYEVFYKMNAGSYCQYSGCGQPWGNPQYNPVFVVDAGNMWGMEFFADKFIFRPYASGIDYTWQYQTYPKNILGDSFPKRDKWYWVKVRVFKDKNSGESYLRVKIAPSPPSDIDNDTDFKTVGSFTAPPVFSLPFGKIGFGGWDSGFYFDDIRVRKYVEGANGKEPNCSPGTVKTLSPRQKISLSQPQISPPFFDGKSAYILTETKPFSWLGDVKAFYADCYLNGNCEDEENQNELGTISVFGEIDDNTPKGLGYYLMKALPGNNNRDSIYDNEWMSDGRVIFTHLSDNSTHNFNGFDRFDLSNCQELKAKLETSGTCNANDNFYDPTEKLIRFVRGFYVKDFPASQGRNMDAVQGYGNQNGVPEDDEQWKLGDILHSNPLLIGIPNMLYNLNSYYNFVNNNRGRPLVIYFMSNDGMLHAFEIAKFKNSDVVPRYEPLEPPIELWSFIPEALLGRLKDITGANHSYMADGLLRAIDAQDEDGNWRTILVGEGGRGGSYIFAIDVTHPENPKFLWEINKYSQPEVVNKLGETISAPALGKLKFNNKDKWVAIFGSGYSKDFIKNHTDKKAYLVMINLFTGEIIKTMKVSDKIGNVLTDMSVIRGNDGSIRNVVFGDYYGALWNVSNTVLEQDDSVPDTSMAFKPCYYDSVFTPEESKRPITAMPVVSMDSNSNWWASFGTGDYDEYNPNYPYQRFYGLILGGNTYTDSCNCQSDTTLCGNLRNMTSSNASNINNLSWIIELGHPDANDRTFDNTTSQKDNNERVLRKAEVYGGFVFFTTFQPDNTPCGGGKSRFYAVKYNSGESAEITFPSSSGAKALVSIENGSGLSRTARISAAHIGDLLVDAYRSPFRNVFMKSLAVAGVDGTMRGRLKHTQVQGRGFFKTGTLRDVRSIAGYVKAANGKTYVMAVLQNDPRARKRALRAHDKLIEWVYAGGRSNRRVAMR